MAKSTVKNIPITRMDCPTCIPLLEKEVKRVEGVVEARGNYMTKTLKVTYDSEKAKLKDVEEAIERVGYRIAYKKYPGVFNKLRGFLKREEAEGITPLSDADFHRKALQASGTVAVLFSSDACPTCKVFKQQLREFINKYKGDVVFYEMDISSSETWRKYDVLSIPTVVIFCDGKVSEKFPALPRIEDIEHRLSPRD
jgi:cation transport ATPase